MGWMDGWVCITVVSPESLVKILKVFVIARSTSKWGVTRRGERITFESHPETPQTYRSDHIECYPLQVVTTKIVLHLKWQSHCTWLLRNECTEP